MKIHVVGYAVPSSLESASSSCLGFHTLADSLGTWSLVRDCHVSIPWCQWDSLPPSSSFTQRAISQALIPIHSSVLIEGWDWVNERSNRVHIHLFLDGAPKPWAYTSICVCKPFCFREIYCHVAPSRLTPNLVLRFRPWRFLRFWSTLSGINAL